MTLAVPLSLPLEQVVHRVREIQESLLDDIFIADIYTPDAGTAEAVRNVTYRFVYRHAEKTLKDKDVDKVHSRIAQHITGQLPIRFP